MIIPLRAPTGPISGVLFVVIGLGLLWGTLHLCAKTKDLLQYGIHTTGKVVSADQQTETTTTEDGQGHAQTTQETVFYPVISFEDTQHRPFEFKSRMGSRTAYVKDQQVPLIYLQTDPPGSVIVDEGIWNWMGAGILGTISLSFVVLGCFAVLRALVTN